MMNSSTATVQMRALSERAASKIAARWSDLIFDRPGVTESEANMIYSTMFTGLLAEYSQAELLLLLTDFERRVIANE